MLFLRAHHPCYKAIIDLFASKQKDVSVASIDSIVLDAQLMDEFFSLVLMAAPILSQRSIRHRVFSWLLSFLRLNHWMTMSILLLSMALRWMTLTIHLIQQYKIICPMAWRMILSQSALDSSGLFFLFPGFLSDFGRFLLFWMARIHPSWFFPVPFCWTPQGWGVLVSPWSARVA